MRLIDLTHPFTEEMPVYPGDPVPRLEKVADIDSVGYHLSTLFTGMHAGTHIDAPLHMIPGGGFVSDEPVDRFFGRGYLLDARGRDILGEDLLGGKVVKPGEIVLVLTGWSERFRKPDYYRDYPQMTPALARRLAECGASMVGLDTPSPDREPFEVHKILLGAGVLIIENLCNLESLVGTGDFEVIALPAKLRSEAGPVRVVARIADTPGRTRIRP